MRVCPIGWTRTRVEGWTDQLSIDSCNLHVQQVLCSCVQLRFRPTRWHYCQMITCQDQGIVIPLWCLGFARVRVCSYGSESFAIIVFVFCRSHQSLSSSYRNTLKDQRQARSRVALPSPEFCTQKSALTLPSSRARCLVLDAIYGSSSHVCSLSSASTTGAALDHASGTSAGNQLLVESSQKPLAQQTCPSLIHKYSCN